MPLDNCKTLLNTQEAGVLRKIELNEINGLFGAARSVQKMAGFGGFFSGLTARVLYQAPSTAISWTVYEFIKYILKVNGGADGIESNEDTLATLKREKTRGEETAKWKGILYFDELAGESNDAHHSGEDECRVGSSVDHTTSLPSDRRHHLIAASTRQSIPSISSNKSPLSIKIEYYYTISTSASKFYNRI